MGGGTQGLTKQSNLGRWKFSLRVSQTHESAGPKAQAVVSSLAQGEVSVPLVLRRDRPGSASVQGSWSSGTGQTGISSPTAPWGLCPWQRDSARIVILVSRSPPSLGGETPRSVLAGHGSACRSVRQLVG